MNKIRNQNQVKTFRLARGWSQGELAERTGISRTAISAIESQRLAPSVNSAMALAKVFGCSVEALFGDPSSAPSAIWAWKSRSSTGRFWQAEVAGRMVCYPAHATPMLTPLPHGTRGDHQRTDCIATGRETLVLAGCDPTAGLLANLYAQQSELQLLVFRRSSREALQMLKDGLIHLAGLHLSTKDDPARNACTVREMLGEGYQLLRIVRWQEGIAIAPKVQLRSARAVLHARLSWIGREAGSGAWHCLNRLLADRSHPRRIARSHHGVIEAIQSGWADAGISVRIVCEEAGLDFLPVQDEFYDVCFPGGFADDRRLRAFLNVVRSAEYRHLLAELPGYSTAETGDFVGRS